MPECTVHVVEFSGRNLAAVQTRTSMSHAAQDCAALWRSFMERMPELGCAPAGAYQGPSFGVSVLVSPATGVFDYYAAMALSGDAVVPSGMQAVQLNAGLYAKCEVLSLGDLTDVYNFIYTKWLSDEHAYALDEQGKCFEYYDERFLLNGSFDVYVPLCQKN